MDPTPAEMEKFTDVANVASWAGMSDPTRDSWFSYLGVGGSAHIRIIGGIDLKEYENLVAKWRLPGEGEQTQQPTPAQVSQAGLIGRAVRIALGLQRTVEAQRQHETEQSCAVLTAANNAGSVNVAVAGKTMVKMCQAVN